MENEISHEIRTRIISLGTKLKCLKVTDDYSSNTISEFFTEKFNYALPLLMAEIIYNLEFIDKSKDKFIALMKEYNKENNTELEFTSFENICWIRLIHNEVQIPAMIDHFMWRINNDYDKEIGKIPIEKKDISLFLLCYYKYIHNEKGKITPEKLDGIIDKLKLKKEAISFLTVKHILEFDNGFYFWAIEHYPKPLEDEIAALLWLREKEDNRLEESFFRFYNLIRKTHIHLNDLSKYLTGNDCLELFLQSITYLKNESDLKISEKESAKIWFDSEGFSRENIFVDVPTLSFYVTDTYELLKKIEDNYDFWRLKDCIYMQKSRSFSYTLLRYITIYEINNSFNKSRTIEIIKDISRPSLIFEILFIIERTYPELIPWFHVDLSLSPLAMNILYEYNINSNYFSNDPGLYDKYEKELSLKNNLWLESFDIVLSNVSEDCRRNTSDKQQMGKTLALIFLDLSKRIFGLYLTINTNNKQQLENLFKLYSECLIRLQNIKTNPSYYYGNTPLRQSLFPFLFKHIMKFVIEQIKELKIFNRNSLSFYFEYYDITIDFIRTVNNMYNMERITNDLKEENEIIEKEIISLLFDNLCLYLNIENIVKTGKSDKYWFGVYLDKLDYIDWGYFFILLYKYELLDKLENIFNTSIMIDMSGNRYTDQNHNQIGKCIMIFRIVYLAYTSLKSMRTDIYATGVRINNICDFLEEFIIKYSVIYSIDNFKERRFDVFDDFPAASIDRKGKSLLELLFYSVNYMTEIQQVKFIENYFLNSIKLDRMLAAINAIRNGSTNKIVSDYIKKINIEKFVDSCLMITNIEETVFQALYSDQHWEIAGSLISRIKKHYAKRKFNDEQICYLLYQADLLLALRKKDLNAIRSVEFTMEEYYSRKYKIIESKQFYIAIHKIDNENDYSNAVIILKEILLSDPLNTSYGINLLRASVFEALNKEELDTSLINISYSNWTKFLNNLGETKEIFIAKNKVDIHFYSIPYFILNNKTIEFDNAISYLSEEQKYHELFIEIIYNFYSVRNLEPAAYNYINDANNYYVKIKKDVPEFINKILSIPNIIYLNNLKQSFETIISRHYISVPKIVPDIINYEKELNYFILSEIIQSLQQMLIKIQTVNNLKDEDNYTDILQLMLKLRFPFYGWSISDHSHYATSAKGIAPGEPDLVVESFSKPITIIEALILKSKDKNKVHKHIRQCIHYSNSLKRCYILIYYKGKKIKFNETWEKYKEDFKLYKFPEGKKMSGNFITLNEKFDNIENILIAQTFHSSIEIFHIMVNFSTEDDRDA